jgi:DNA polymerase/3'-5' exonuclease PolX
MPVHNSEIAEMFEEVADLLEIEGAKECRSRASPGIGTLPRIPGLGAKRIRVLCDELKITGVED